MLFFDILKNFKLTRKAEFHSNFIKMFM